MERIGTRTVLAEVIAVREDTFFQFLMLGSDSGEEKVENNAEKASLHFLKNSVPCKVESYKW